MGLKSKTVNAKTTTQFRSEYCERLVAFGKTGKSVIQFCAEIGVCEDTFYEWVKKYPAFDRARVQYRVNAQAHWEDLGHAHITAYKDKDGHENFDTGLYKFIVGGRFGMSHQPKIRNERLGSGTLLERAQALLDMTASGEILPDQAKAISSILKDTIDVEVHVELKAKLDELERRVDTMGATRVETKMADEPDFTE